MKVFILTIAAFAVVGQLHAMPSKSQSGRKATAFLRNLQFFNSKLHENVREIQHKNKVRTQQVVHTIVPMPGSDCERIYTDFQAVVDAMLLITTEDEVRGTFSLMDPSGNFDVLNPSELTEFSCFLADLDINDVMAEIGTENKEEARTMWREMEAAFSMIEETYAEMIKMLEEYGATQMPEYDAAVKFHKLIVTIQDVGVFRI